MYAANDDNSLQEEGKLEINRLLNLHNISVSMCARGLKHR